jgi:hypothetical protein
VTCGAALFDVATNMGTRSRINVASSSIALVLLFVGGAIQHLRTRGMALRRMRFDHDLKYRPLP